MIYVLDVDETLVHSVEDGVVPDDGDFMVLGYAVRKRPYVDELLDYLVNHPDHVVGVWSAATHDYVHQILDNIMCPEYKSRLAFVLTREDCSRVLLSTGYVDRIKPLSKVKDMFLDIHAHDILLIDDKDGVTGYDHLNHLKIASFEGDDEDNELLTLIRFLDMNNGHPSEVLVCYWK
jgi:TFIIF-interacting CTD phosphatase-like protein